MSAYLIVRRWQSTGAAEDYLERMLATDEPQAIAWDHTHVAEHASGELTSFCVYEAPSAEVLRAHISSLGGFELEGIYAVTSELDPEHLSRS